MLRPRMTRLWRRSRPALAYFLGAAIRWTNTFYSAIPSEAARSLRQGPWTRRWLWFKKPGFLFCFGALRNFVRATRFYFQWGEGVSRVELIHEAGGWGEKQSHSSPHGALGVRTVSRKHRARTSTIMLRKHFNCRVGEVRTPGAGSAVSRCMECTGRDTHSTTSRR